VRVGIAKHGLEYNDYILPVMGPFIGIMLFVSAARLAIKT